MANRPSRAERTHPRCELHSLRCNGRNHGHWTLRAHAGCRGSTPLAVKGGFLPRIVKKLKTGGTKNVLNLLQPTE